jgi:subtilisin inhibitor-like
MIAAATALTSLTIAVSPGYGGAVQHWTLTCGPAGGTLPRAAAACTRLGRLKRPFAEVPAGTMCTQIFGGPQTARVSGTYGGLKIRATFDRRNGCETARWQRLAFLFVGADS